MGPPKILATDTGKSGPGAQTITGGDVIMTFGADGKPLSYTRGSGANLINQADPGGGFILAYGTGTSEKKVPLSSPESKDGNLIASAGPDQPRVTFAVNSGLNHIAFQLEKIENIPPTDNPILSFEAKFNNVRPEVVPLAYMASSRGLFASVRCFISVSWPYLWNRGDGDPLGGFAFFIPLNDEDHNEALLHI